MARKGNRASKAHVLNPYANSSAQRSLLGQSTTVDTAEVQGGECPRAPTTSAARGLPGKPIEPHKRAVQLGRIVLKTILKK